MINEKTEQFIIACLRQSKFRHYPLVASYVSRQGGLNLFFGYMGFDKRTTIVSFPPTWKIPTFGENPEENIRSFFQDVTANKCFFSKAGYNPLGNTWVASFDGALWDAFGVLPGDWKNFSLDNLPPLPPIEDDGNDPIMRHRHYTQGEEK